MVRGIYTIDTWKRFAHSAIIAAELRRFKPRTRSVSFPNRLRFTIFRTCYSGKIRCDTIYKIKKFDA